MNKLLYRRSISLVLPLLIFAGFYYPLFGYGIHIVIDRDLRVVLSTGAFEKDSLIGAIEEVVTLKGGKRNDL